MNKCKYCVFRCLSEMNKNKVQEWKEQSCTRGSALETKVDEN